MKVKTRGLVAFAATLFAAGVALADGAHDPAAAEVLFRAGRDAMKAGDFATACPKFAESQRLDPAAGTLLNLAECEEKSGKLASAWSHLHDAIDQLKAGDDRIPGVKKHEAALDKRVPHLVLSVAAGGEKGRVLRDGVDLGTASLGVPLPVDPGAHEIALLVPGHAEQRVSVTLKEAETRTVTLTPGAPIDDAAPPPATSAAPITSAAPPIATGAPAERPPSSGSGSGRAAGVVLASVGGVSLVAMGVTGVLAIGKKNTVKSDCDAGHVCSQAGVDAASAGKTLSTISTVTGIIGIAGLGLGTVLLFTSSSGDAVGFSPLPGGGAASLRGAF